ncbi:hypothetical protein SAMN05421743_101142 [Thalassobacillus cyri]|uniref:Uncharacterized protein n=1 Tax=Thalassobacillus cyri TaxID=571932 RepID=A0A1H3VQW8_9BACI|nr:hypothetical protein [Thalassobacillus cyri]SDZ77187.1 hypothetical protein SAMN05421743_101142 [Thalassobacillus cyri]
MNGNQGQRNTWLALGTAGVVGAAAMYGISRMNRNGGLQQLTQNAQNSQVMKSIQNNLPQGNNEVNNANDEIGYSLPKNEEI